MTMKRILAGLTALGLLLLTAPAGAVTATGTTSVQITVAADASITVPATCTLTTAGAFASYTGTCLNTYSVRTTKVGGTGQIQLQAPADWTAVAGGSGPKIATDNLSFTISGNTGPGTQNAVLTQIAALATSYNVITAMGANAHASNATFSTDFTLVNNAAWETDTYKINIQYTLTST
jgi:beta-lactam-binding protein with PASTA domain